jgi:hypothetical protein
MDLVVSTLGLELESNKNNKFGFMKRGRILPLFYFCAWLSAQQSISLSDIPTGENVKQSGKKLMKFDDGFIEIIAGESADLDTVYVAVHGYGSRGYEWVDALRTMAETGKKTLFYRYDWNLCPKVISDKLSADLAAWLKQNESSPYLIIFSHSYGGTVTTSFSGTYSLDVSAEIHSIAAPLGHHIRFSEKCGYENGILFDSTFTLANGIKHIQWRTSHSADGAFRNLEIDPQIVQIKGSTVHELPATFRGGKRLGHNWSVTYVIEQVFR